MSTRTVHLSELVEDFSLYPRHMVADVHVADLVQALRANVTLPPIVMDAATMRIVDGVHRSRALRRVLGETAKVKVDARTYASDAELFEDAVRLNAGHGRKLDRHDQVRVILRARELGSSDERISVALAVPPERVSELALRVAVSPAGDQIPLKQGAQHLAGRTLTEEQMDALKRMRGQQTGRLIGELTRALEAGMVDFTDNRVCEQLHELAMLIGEKVPAVRPAA